MNGPGTGPKRRLSTAPAPGLSDSSHQPPSTRRAARLTRSISGRPGWRASTIWPGRIRRVRRLREEARRARDEALGADRLGEPAGARFHSGEQDWDQPGGWGGPGWTDWPGRRGWEEWARMRGRAGWGGTLDFGTLRDLERVAVQFTSDLRKLAMQSSVVGENVITDLRTVLEDALERNKSEIFGPGRPDHPGQGPADSPADDPAENPAEQD